MIEGAPIGMSFTFHDTYYRSHDSTYGKVSNSLKRDIKRVTQKVLTQTLRKLERDGLVSRTVHATAPVTVEYALTPLGQTLTDTVSALTHWAELNMDAVLAAQTAYDSAAQQAAVQAASVHRMGTRPALSPASPA